MTGCYGHDADHHIDNLLGSQEKRGQGFYGDDKHILIKLRWIIWGGSGWWIKLKLNKEGRVMVSWGKWQVGDSQHDEWRTCNDAKGGGNDNDDNVEDQSLWWQ